ncbi:peptidoglycan bridge formation glycyltransferase FemA/FemB family protein [Candidatus Dojkabacteria bacterium]|nr:peptidoglycan bridge formation glycyltransferase FemA/FemB family protein [Candidatus Dojkabacteria bacterium]
MRKLYTINTSEDWKKYERFASQFKEYSLWQGKEWHDYLNNSERSAIGFLVIENDKIRASSICQVHKLPLGFKWYYFPRGPLLSPGFSLSDFLNCLDDNKTVYAKVELPYQKGEFDNLGGLQPKFRKPKSETNPSTTLVIDLTQSVEEILAQMKSKGRYNVRLAERKGVCVKKSQDISKFYKLLTQTADRQGLRIHEIGVYEKMLSELDSEMFIAEYEGKILSSAITVYFNGCATYYYGASSSKHRDTMSPYLLQYEMMKEAKLRGCRIYDFMGIAPQGVKDHALSGITQFKKKFGGQVVSYMPGIIYAFKLLLFKGLNISRPR